MGAFYASIIPTLYSKHARAAKYAVNLGTDEESKESLRIYIIKE
jgi:hypothetical protein